MADDFDWLFGDPDPPLAGGVQKPSKDQEEERAIETVHTSEAKTGVIQGDDLEAESAGGVRASGAASDSREVEDSRGDGEGGKGASLQGNAGGDFAAASEALKGISQAQLVNLFAGIKGSGSVQGLHDSDQGDVQPVSGRDSDRGDSGPVHQDELQLRSGELVPPVPVLQRTEDGGDALAPVQDLVEGLEEGVEGQEGDEAGAGPQSTTFRSMEESTGVFFPGPTGEHAGHIQAGMKDAAWELRRDSTIEYRFPWAEGVSEEQKEKYEDQLKGIVPRMGAKSKLRDWLIPRFPEHHTYIEPFGGSFKILLWKFRRSKIEIINDVDSDLIHFFRYVTYYPKEVAKMVNSLPTHKGLLDALREELKRGDLGGLERAAAVYYSVKLSFNGTGNGYAGSVQSLCSARADPTEFQRVADRLRGVDIRCQDAHDLIAGTNRRLDHGRYPGGLFYYLDPPYDETAGYATLTSKSIYGKQEQFALFNLAKKIHEAGNRFIMTNSYTDYLRNMWGSVDAFHSIKRMVKYDISGSAENRKETAELIVSNFPLTAAKAKTKQAGLFS